MTMFDISREEIRKRADTPLYRAIAEAIGQAVHQGRLSGGDKLPPMRELAYRLEVTVGTVARAYDLVVQQGLAEAHVGRGTFVASVEASPIQSPALETLSMRMAVPPDVGQGVALAHLLSEVAERNAQTVFNSYLPAGGDQRHRSAAARWTSHAAFDPKPDEMLVCSGAQQAILASLFAATKPGQVVLVEELSFRATVDQILSMGRRPVPVQIDEQGMVADALEEAAARHRAQAVLVVPNLHNPTTTVMGEKRRQEIAEIVGKRGLALIEDDVYGTYLPDRPLPISALASENSYFVSSLSKSIGCGIRVGFVRPPTAKLEVCRAALRSFGQTLPALIAEMTACLIESGSAEELNAKARVEMAARHALCREHLGAAVYGGHPAALYAWCNPGPCWSSGYAFAEAARARGVDVAVAEDFVIATEDRFAGFVRLALSQPSGRNALERSLSIVSDLMRGGPGAAPVLV